MKKYILSLLAVCFLAPISSYASSVLEGNWRIDDSTQFAQIKEFDGIVTYTSQSYYSNGAVVNWFFEFRLPKGRDAQVDEIIKGRVRSVDGYFNCVFDEPAKAQLQSNGVLKVHYPLLTYHWETRSVRDGNAGHYNRHAVDWNGWSWVETHYGFPIDHYRVISAGCVIDKRNPYTNVLTKTNSPF